MTDATYFVAYHHPDGFGDMVVDLDAPICNGDGIDALRGQVQQRVGTDVSIQNFVLLRDPDDPGRLPTWPVTATT